MKITRELIHNIGKESNELELSEVLGVFSEDTILYDNYQKRLHEIIGNLTLEKVLEIGISRRTYFDWRKKIKEGMSVILKNKLENKLRILF